MVAAKGVGEIGEDAAGLAPGLPRGAFRRGRLRGIEQAGGALDGDGVGGLDGPHRQAQIVERRPPPDDRLERRPPGGI